MYTKWKGFLMNKFLQVVFWSILSILIILYLTFLFVVPNIININNYKPLIQSIVKEQAKLDFDFDNAKIITTPLLGAGVKLDNVKVLLPDNSLLLSADSIKTRVSIPSVFVMTIKLSCFEIENPLINLEIAEDNIDYKLIKLIEDILNEKKEQTLGEDVVQEKSFFNPKWIRIKVPSLKLNNYKILVKDLSSGHSIDLRGEKLIAGYFNRKRLKIKTSAELYSDSTRNIVANIDINTFLPKPKPGLDAEDDPAERIDISFINPVRTYQEYDLKTNIDTKIKINKHKDGSITSFGHINVEDVTMKISQLKLPKSYIKIKTFGSLMEVDSNIYAAENQNIQLLGKLNYSKNPKLDMNVKTGEIRFNDMLILARAFLDSLKIPHELGQYSAEGSLISDCYIKTNFKKLKSNGFIKVQNGGLIVRNLGKVISGANINANLEDSVLTLKDSCLYINQSKVVVDGFIDKHSVADISVKTDNLPLTPLFNAFAVKAMRDNFDLSSGNVSLNMIIKGKLKEAISSVNFKLSGLNFSDKKKNFVLKDSELSGQFILNSKIKALTGSIFNNGFNFILPKTNSSLRVPKLNIEIADNNILINENEILFNEKSKIKFLGEVNNYTKLDNVNVSANGNIDTEDIIKLIGNEYKMYIDSKGVIPIKILLDGNRKKQTFIFQALADKNNYIAPVEFTEIAGKQTSLQAIADLKPGRIKIKKTGLFTRAVTIDEKGNEIVNLDSIIDIDGTIAGKRINLIKVNIPKNLSGKIFVFPRSSLLCEKSHLFIFGQTSSPIIRGTINIKELTIPEILTNIENINLNFKGHNLDFHLSNVLMNNSDVSVKGTLDLLKSELINISNLDITSKYIKLEKILEVVERLQRYTPKTEKSSSKSSKNVNIPVIVHFGSLSMNKILTGNIEVNKTVSDLTLTNNILGLKNLTTSIFKGNVSGNIRVNLLTMLVYLDIKGNRIDVEKALLDAANMKNMLTGIADFNAKLNINGAATSMEAQMKGISGDINFKVTNGQFGPFGKIENLIIAENIRESQFFQTALGGIINSLTSIDTTHFAELAGHLNLEDGICHIDPITSLGNILSLHVFGDFDLVNNYADMKVRARMASIISQLLGPLNAINPINLMNSAASLNVVTAKAFSLFCEVVPSSELEMLPSFANKYVDSGAAKFQLKVRGDAAKPLKLVKSFKWLSSKTEYDEAVEFVNSLPEEIEGSTATNIEEAIAEAKALEAEKKTVKYKLKHMFDKKNTSKITPNNSENSSVEQSSDIENLEIEQ